jgi:hypothetical protein
MMLSRGAMGFGCILMMLCRLEPLDFSRLMFACTNGNPATCQLVPA